jgi:hypothetical protein
MHLAIIHINAYEWDRVKFTLINIKINARLGRLILCLSAMIRQHFTSTTKYKNIPHIHASIQKIFRHGKC